MLLSPLHATCSSSRCYAEYNVFITLVHTHTKKKKKKNCTCYKRFVVVTNGRFVTYGIRAGSTHDLGSLRISLT
jgi:hypothetical protein